MALILILLPSLFLSLFLSQYSRNPLIKLQNIRNLEESIASSKSTESTIRILILNGITVEIVESSNLMESKS